MEKKEAPVKKRLLQYLKENKVKHSVFTSKTSISSSVLKRKDCELSVPSIVHILTAFPDLSAEWLLLGAGSPNKVDNMGLVTVRVADIIADKNKLIDTKDKYILLLEQSREKKPNKG